MPKIGRIWGGGGAGPGVPAAAPRRGWGALWRPARRTAARWSGPARGAWAGRRALYFIDFSLFLIPFGKICSFRGEFAFCFVFRGIAGALQVTGSRFDQPDVTWSPLAASCYLNKQKKKQTDTNGSYRVG